MNPALASYLERDRTSSVRDESRSAPSEAQSYVSIAKQRPARVRLSEADIADIVACFERGTAKHVLASRYGIGLTTVKKLLREHGVKGHSGKWSRNKENAG